MTLDPKEYLPLAAALASVAGALSAIAFAFLQSTVAKRLELEEQASEARAEQSNRIRALNDHLREHRVSRAVAEDVSSAATFRTGLMEALQEGVGKVSPHLEATVIKYSNSSIDNMSRALVDQAGPDGKAIAALMSFFKGRFTSEITDLILRIARLDSFFAKTTRQASALAQLSLVSGLSVLALCASSVPPIQWDQLHFCLLMGVALIFSFYGMLFQISAQDIIGSRGWARGRKLDLLFFVGCGIFAVLAYGALLWRVLH